MCSEMTRLQLFKYINHSQCFSQNTSIQWQYKSEDLWKIGADGNRCIRIVYQAYESIGQAHGKNIHRKYAKTTVMERVIQQTNFATETFVTGPDLSDIVGLAKWVSGHNR